MYLKFKINNSAILNSNFKWPNFGEAYKARTKGFETSLDYSKTLGVKSWVKAQGNFIYSTGKFLFYEEPTYPANEYYLQRAGQSINQSWGLIAERLFIDEYDVMNSPKQNYGEYMAGDIKYYDANGDGEITDLDRVPIGFPTVPEIMYGGGMSFGVSAFDFSFFLQGSARSSFWIDPYRTAPFIQNPSLGAGSQNALLKVYADNYWSEDNRNTYALWPRLSHTRNVNNTQHSTWFMQNGAFLRLKSVELGYTLPKNLIRSVNLNSRIYLSGLNLLTFSGFKYWDIEMGGNGLGYPIQKVINLGLTVNF